MAEIKSPIDPTDRQPIGRISRPAVLLLLGLGGLFLWSFWPTLGEMAGKWSSDPQYSHGYLVPVFSLVLLYLRRDRMPAQLLDPKWAGAVVVAMGAGLYVAGGMANVDYIEAAASVLALAGLVAAVTGYGGLRWALPSILFLVFMLPLPYRFERTMGYELQRIATIGSTYVLQTVGLPAIAEGNVILLDKERIGVVEACSGLSMLLTFVALATGMAMVVRRPMLDKVLIVLSSVPIAVLVNILRISTTGMAQEWISPEAADKIFHDWAGWLMMPAALAFLFAELWALSRLLVERPDQKPFVNPLNVSA